MSPSPAIAPSEALKLTPGKLFEGRWRIDTLIGAGGFAHVYRAVQEDLNRVVALKVLLPHEWTPDGKAGYSPSLVDRFLREAKLVSMLRDPHTITMYDFGRSEKGLLYMVFEFIDGISLKQLSNKEGKIAPDRVIKILRQTLESLHEAHSLGVMHRDIKPGNIMVFSHVGRADQVKVLDFGIAKTVQQEQGQTMHDLTGDGALIGTPRYMSPEQIRGDELTPASDLYSLGLCCYELLTARQAIDKSDTMQIIAAQLQTGSFLLPPDLALPENLRRAVDSMMSKHLARRPQTADAVLDILDEGPQVSARSRPAPARAKMATGPVDLFGDDDGAPTQIANASRPPRRPPVDRTGPVNRGPDPTPAPAPRMTPTGAIPAIPRNAPPSLGAGDHTGGNVGLSSSSSATADPSILTDSPSGISAPDEAGGRARLLVPLLVLVVLLAAGVGWLALSGEEEPPVESEELALVDPPAVEPAPAEPADPVVIAAREPDPEEEIVEEAAEAAKAEEAEEPKPLKLMAFNTQPSGATIKIDGVVIGRSPIRLRADAYQFPMTLEIVAPDGSTISRTISQPADELTIPLPVAVEEDKEDEPPKAASRSRRSSRPRTTSPPKPRVEERPAENDQPAEEEPADPVRPTGVKMRKLDEF